MNKRKKINLAVWALMMLVFVLVIYREYKHNLRTCQITFQSEVSPETDGLERFIVSDIEGVQRTCTEGFEYEADKARYVLHTGNMIPGQPCFLNLETAVWNKPDFLLEYRLRSQDNSVHENDKAVITCYDSRGTELERKVVPLVNFQNYKFRYNYTFNYDMPILTAVLATALLLVALWISRRNFWGVLISAAVACLCVYKFLVFLAVPVLVCTAVAVLGIVIHRTIMMRNDPDGDVLREMAISAGFFTFTIVLYVPAQLVMTNSNDFGLAFWGGLLPSLLFYSALSMAGLYVICLCLPGKKLKSCFLWLVYLVTLGAYVQLNFLNPDFPSFNGEEIDFSIYGTHGTVSAVFWSTLAVVYILICTGVYRNSFTNRIKKYCGYLAGALCLMQLASLAVLVLSVRIPSEHFQRFTCEGEHELAAEDNTVIFLVDTLSADAFSEWLDNSEKTDIIGDFVVYDNYITTASPTLYSVPTLLTGQEFSQLDDLSHVIDEIYAEDNSLRKLKNFDMDLRVYSDGESVHGNIADFVDNVHAIKGRRIRDEIVFGKELYKLVGFAVSPMQLKPWIETSAGNLTDWIKGGDDYKLSNVAAYERLLSEGLYVGDYDRAFRLYHLHGLHGLNGNYENNAQMKRPPGNEQECLEGVMLHIGTYIDGLKKLGLYDRSMIVITGDHGRHGSKDLSKANAALAIKYPHGSGSSEPDHTPVISRNILATVAQNLGEEYTSFGPAISDLDMTSYGERIHTCDGTVSWTVELDEPYRLMNEQGSRYVLEGNAHDGTLTYREWNPYIDNMLAFGLDKTSINMGTFPEGTEYSFAVDTADIKADRLKIQISDILGDRQAVILRVNGRTAARAVIEAPSLASAPAVITSELPNKAEEPVLCELIFPNACTPNQLDRSNPDRVVKSVKIDSVAIE